MSYLGVADVLFRFGEIITDAEHSQHELRYYDLQPHITLIFSYMPIGSPVALNGIPRHLHIHQKFFKPRGLWHSLQPVQATTVNTLAAQSPKMKLQDLTLYLMMKPKDWQISEHVR